MDSLSRLLSLYTVRTSLDMRCELGAPWVLDEPPSAPGEAAFHLIAGGRARVEAPGIDPLELKAGDIVVFPGGSAHRLLAGAPEEAIAATELPAAGPLRLKSNLGAGGGTPSAAILCGRFLFDDGARSVLLGALPPVIVMQGRQEEADGLPALVRILQHETADTRPGAGAVVAQLSGALFALLMRAWLEQSATTPGMFAVLADRRLGKAMQRMLEAPEQPWRVEDLAHDCHMSRATFARLFARLCGMAPLDALTRLRMARAALALARDGQAVGEVAAAVGYQSEAAFQRVFKRHYGVGPGAYRRGGLPDSGRVNPAPT
jgi:AraC family transcriptional activator of mtrCDE